MVTKTPQQWSFASPSQPRLRLATVVISLVLSLVGQPPRPVAAAGTWSQTFFSDADLNTVCGTRIETDIYIFRDSDAGWATPPGCPNIQSTWSVRMERHDVYFQGGSYEFGLFYDLAARLYIDDQLVVDGWSATQHYEWRELLAGNHSLRLEYKNSAGPAILQMLWRGPGALPNTTETQDSNQWWVNYWGNPNQWQDSVGRRNEGGGFLSFDYGNNSPGFGLPADHFSLKFERTVPFECGAYRFHVIADDGYRLKLDNVLIQDRWSAGGWDESWVVTMTAASHAVQLDYLERTGAARVSLDWTLERPCITPVYELALRKQVSPEAVSPGQRVQVVVTATSHLSGTAVMTDELGTGLNFEAGSASPSVIYDPQLRVVRYAAPVLPGTPITLSYAARVSASVLPGSVLVTRASIALGPDTAETLVALVVPESTFTGTLMLIYAIGDNNLSDELLVLLNNAERAAGNTHVIILVMLDGPGVQDARVFRLRKDDNPVCPNFVNVQCQGRYSDGQNVWSWTDDTATVASLAEFVNSTMRTYPDSKRVMLSLVGHGEGFAPDLPGGLPGQGGDGGKPGGLLEDLHPVRGLSTRELGQALRLGVEGTQRQIDLLFLDSCMMATLETLYELRNAAQYVLASQSWSWTAFPYEAYIADVEDRYSTPEIGRHWLARAASSAAEYLLPNTYSLIDLSQINGLANSLDQLSLAVSAALPVSRSQVAGAFASAEGFDSSQDGYIGSDDEMRDLASLTRELKRQLPLATVTQAADAVMTALASAVLSETHSAGIPTRYSNQEWRWATLGGISVFAPGTTDHWKRRYYTETQVSLAKMTHWDELLSAVWTGTPPTKPANCAVNREACLSPSPLALPPIALDVRGGRDSVLLRWRVTGRLNDFARFEVERSTAGAPDAFTVLTTTTTSQYADWRGANQFSSVDYCYRIVSVRASGLRVATSNTACATLGKLGLWIPHVAAPPGSNDVLVPINVDNGDGMCAIGMTIVVRYNAAIAEPTGSLSNTVYSQGYVFRINISTPGTIKITQSGNCTPLHGPGTLLLLGFRTNGSEGQTNSLEFITGVGNTEVYDQRDATTAVTLRALNGSLSLKNAFVRGDVNGKDGVTIGDAVLALQIANGQYVATPVQLAACEVSGDGRCTAADASLIECFVLNHGRWDVCTLPTTDTTHASRPPANPSVASDPIRVCTTQAALPGGTRNITVFAQNAAEVASADFTVLFDPQQAEYISAAAVELNSAATAHSQRPGVLRVSITRTLSVSDTFPALTLAMRPLTNTSTVLAQVVTAVLADGEGRDVVESALQRRVEIGACVPVPSAPRYTVFLPMILR